MDVPAEEIAALLAAGPEGFVTTRTARARALRAEGRREEATALAAVRKPRRLTWALVDLQRTEPDLVAEAVEAAEAMERAQAEGAPVRTHLSALRAALDRLAEALPAAAPGVDPTEATLAARQVLATPGGRAAWTEGRLLQVEDPGDGPAAAPAPADSRTDEDDATGGDRPRSARGADRGGRTGPGAARRASPPDDGDAPRAAEDADDARAAAGAARRRELHEAADRAQDALEAARRAVEEAQASSDAAEVARAEAEEALARAEADLAKARAVLAARHEELAAAEDELATRRAEADTSDPPAPPRPTPRRRGRAR